MHVSCPFSTRFQPPANSTGDGFDNTILEDWGKSQGGGSEGEKKNPKQFNKLISHEKRGREQLVGVLHRWIDPDRPKWMLALARSQSWRSTSHNLNNSPAGLLIQPPPSVGCSQTLMLPLQQSHHCLTVKVPRRRNLSFTKHERDWNPMLWVVSLNRSAALHDYDNPY